MKSAGRSLTYSTLQSMSQSLSSALRARGVGRGDRVGIYVPLSLASVVGVFGIMSTGASYVPFDPSAPAKRLASISNDCGLKVFVSSSAMTSKINDMLHEGGKIDSVVLVDCDLSPSNQGNGSSLHPNINAVKWSEVLARTFDSSLETSSQSSDIAYILYTSGSTGTPKGVMISHANSLSFVNWAAEFVALGPQDIVACHAPLHFDLSTFSIFSSCLAGAETSLVTPGVSMFPTQLAGQIQRERISVWYSVPSVLTMMVLYGNLSAYDLSSLRTIIFAGEVFPVKYLQTLMSILPKVRYLNWYGPTETNVCTSYEVSSVEKYGTSQIPIGKACANLECFVVGSNGEKIENPGETGELYVTGPSLMQGYWGNPQETATRLVKNPLDASSRGLAYKTGDLVSLDEEGNYLYIGREDGMIKTRGYRVESGEIESVLYAHPSIKDAVVLPLPDPLFGNRLRAVVSLHAGANLNKEDLLAHCRRFLPQYMTPDLVEFLQELPRTSTGKIDRRTLSQQIPGEAKSS